ncbi:acid phosphatase [Besnoitia besnoiti]|uniref:Acid phosphatase n=1 Tax=Besnoitia besnoiti TaxID=94643 RepID=A0A2A9MFG3_BESBE|nr:acid phosphatase [Besnoitia besnoiti]PFH34991.1 acid phosphatase [Besnoitia besnoiti]
MAAKRGFHLARGVRSPCLALALALAFISCILSPSSIDFLFPISSHGRFLAFADAADGSPQLKRTGPISRRLDGLITKSVKRLLTWHPVERRVPSINMDNVVFIAGNHRANLSAAVDVTLEDVLILFFRWFHDSKSTAWPAQGLITMEALKREHKSYGNQMVKEYTKKQEEPEQDEEKKNAKLLPIQVYAQLGVCQRRFREWFFDGNTFHRRGGEAFNISDELTEKDVDFMRGLPYSVIRLAQGVFAEQTPASVKRLEHELSVRGVTTLEQLLSRTNFFDLFVLFDLLDETFTQIDVLREFHRNWEKYRSRKYLPPQIPLGEWKEKHTMEEILLDDHYSAADFPKCTTLKCIMQWTWRKTPERTIEVNDVNALKLLLVGSPGREETYRRESTRKQWSWLKRAARINDLENTVQALKEWHEREKADGVLGLGDMLGLPGPTTVRDERFRKKWYDIFVKDGGLDLPWLITLGDSDAVLSPSSQVRYHYSVQEKNWHMPNDYYTVTFKFGANLTLANGMYEETTFNATILSINTWDLFVGTPVANNMQSWSKKLWWLSEQLYQATQKNSTWLIVMGHHPLLSTGPAGEQGRLQFVDDLYKNKAPRGLETLMINMLFMHYQVDAYVSGHDSFMDFNSITDVDRNVTVSFISSGATARLLDEDIGRGWVGRLRGAMYPVLCWGGRKILYQLHPGGCRPLHRDQQSPEKFFVQAQHGNYKVDIVERVTKATGFAAMKLTRDYMLVDFIDSRTKKSAVHKVHRRTNRDGRDIKFMDPYAEGKLRYEELMLDREAFEWENADLIEKETTFARNCPVLAERLRFLVSEMNDLTSKYEDLARQKDSYEVMDDPTREVMAAQGTNVPNKISQILSDMYIVAADHYKLEKRYKQILEIKEKSPEGEDPRYKKLFELEKQYVETRKLRRRIEAALQSDDGTADADDEQILEKAIRNMKLLRKDIDDLEREMERYPDLEKKKAADEKRAKREKEEHQQEPKKFPELKPLDTSLLARIRRKEMQLRRHHEVLRGLKHFPESELKKMRSEIGILKKQEASLRQELNRLQMLRKRAQSPMRPSDVWEKFQVKEELERRLRQIRAYQRDVAQAPAARRHAQTTEEEMEAIETQRAATEKELIEVVDELADRQMTPLQKEFMRMDDELKTTELILEQRKLLSTEALAVPRVQQALQQAVTKQHTLHVEVDKIHDMVRQELNALDDEWEKDMLAKGYKLQELGEGVVVGPNVEQLSPGDASKVADSGELDRANETVDKLKEAEDALAVVDEAIQTAKTADGEEKAELEAMFGPVEELPAKREEVEEQVDALKESLELEAAALEKRVPSKASKQDDEHTDAGSQEDDSSRNLESPEGSSPRGLQEILELFKGKREPSPYKKLEKIDVGQMDTCAQMPMLQAAIQRRLAPQSEEDAKDKCVYHLANQAYRQQLRYVHEGSFFAQGQLGLTPNVYNEPSVHVARTWSEYFGYKHMNRFKSIMRDLKNQLRFVCSTFKPYSFKEAMEMEVREAERRREEELLLPGDQEIDVKDTDVDMDTLTPEPEAFGTESEDNAKEEEDDAHDSEMTLPEGADISIDDVSMSFED